MITFSIINTNYTLLKSNLCLVKNFISNSSGFLTSECDLKTYELNNQCFILYCLRAYSSERGLDEHWITEVVNNNFVLFAGTSGWGHVDNSELG